MLLTSTIADHILKLILRATNTCSSRFSSKSLLLFATETLTESNKWSKLRLTNHGMPNGYISNPAAAPKAQEQSWKKRQKDRKSQRTRTSAVNSCFLEVKGKLHP